MANRNDFILIKLKSKKMFDYLKVQNSTNLDDLTKERLGFYHLILENVTGFLDSNSSEDTTSEDNSNTCTIIDTVYNRYVNNDPDVDDLGMDAVSIMRSTNGEIDIKLFNFKYRESFNPEKTKSENDISRSTKFLEYLIRNEKLDEKTNSLVHKQINKIISHLNSSKICNISMYMVSNEAKGFSSSSNEYLKLLESNYGMKIINISIDDIIGFYNTKNQDSKSAFMISQNEFLSFQSDEKSTQKSYILKLSLLDLIRISSNNKDLSNNYSIENDEEILSSQLDFSLLYDNVRGYLGDTKYNKNIIDTLINNHQYFFMFNNGITITAENIDCEPKNSGVKYLFTIKNFQIVNGGQTIRSIYRFLNDNEDSKKVSKLREAYVLIRIFKTSKDDTLQNSIAEYTNSQNAISDIDLKSIDIIQIQLERYFSEIGIQYARKAGDLGDVEKEYKERISMEKMAQILYSSIGYPDRASNQKRRLFIDYYDEIFKSEKFSLENCLDQAEKFFEIEKEYNNNTQNYKVSDQKMFYIIYLITFSELNISDAIEHLENLLKSYNADVSEARKLIQKGFRDHLESSFNNQLA
ncbi:AIPR family protein [Lysinibacillus sp. CD3-6]|uniref:AIPR family protein n=1 Tax=Lysinibacillus sp. CD3-6 TaxID=2892541 RepID=UPI001173F27F|nr:AIPR family protein [Lysinibacillus sp. CD3-6]UED78384.1 AIPR family protein [Lysinibacillus sp. CD3-6]